VAAVEPEIRDYYDSKWYEVVKHLSVSNYIWTANWWYMNKDRFEALTPDEQAAIKKSAADTVAWYRAQLAQTYADTEKALQDKGVTITKVDTAPFVEMVKPVYAQFSKEWGEDLVSAVEKAASAN
jgi:TRAP-type C4-dicarboxylate transport system substrate-binding protein